MAERITVNAKLEFDEPDIDDGVLEALKFSITEVIYHDLVAFGYDCDRLAVAGALTVGRDGRGGAMDAAYNVNLRRFNATGHEELQGREKAEGIDAQAVQRILTVHLFTIRSGDRMEMIVEGRDA